MSASIQTSDVTPKALLFGGGILLVALASLVFIGANRYWAQRIPNGWKWTSSYMGVATPPASSGLFPAQDVTAIYERDIRIVDARRGPGQILVADSYVNKEPRTGKVIYHYIVKFTVDPRSGRHLPPHENDYMLFPRNTQRVTYFLRVSYLKGVPLAFESQEDLEGMQVYRFRYAGPMEYTEFYQGTSDVPAMTIPEGQEIRCWEDLYEINYWVEPMTGDVVKVTEACHSADVLVDRVSRAYRSNVLRWSMESTGSDVVARIEETRYRRSLMIATLYFIPLLLLAGGFVLIGFGARNRHALKVWPA